MPDRDVGDSNGRSTDRLLGELIAEVRAVKHNLNNVAMQISAEVKLIRDIQEKHDFRIGALEADKLRRDGAVGLVEWLGRHWPFSIFVGALGAWVAWANGRIG
jgi:hypothetical protein